MEKKLVNIVVCYENEDEVISYAKQMESQKESNKLELVVVVNKKLKGIDYLKKEFSNINLSYKIFDSGKNLGYLNGLLYGFSNLKSDATWYVFSNTDIKFTNCEFFKTFMESKYLLNKKTWLVGPSVYSPNRECYSNPYLKVRPSRNSYILKDVAMSFPNIYELLFNLKTNIKRKEKCQQSSSQVYAVHGSFMFLHKDLLSILANRRPWELLYDEEQYVAEIVRKHDRIVIYDSNIQVLHVEGTSTGKVNIRTRYKRMKRSNARLIKEFY